MGGEGRDELSGHAIGSYDMLLFTLIDRQIFEVIFTDFLQTSGVLKHITEQKQQSY